MQVQQNYRNIQSRNPYTNEVVKDFPFISDSELVQKIEKSWKAYQLARETDVATRIKKIAKVGALLEANPEKYAKIITLEMGKPLKTALAEVKKCADHCYFYVKNGKQILNPKIVMTEARRSQVEFLPVGPIYHITPFNNPFWLVFKGAIPALLIGNTLIHRDADTTPQLGQAIEDLMVEAGFENGEFLNVYSSPEQTELILSNKYVRGVSFTGSTRTGGIIGAIASKYAKKAVMELGGSDPFIVLDDANVDQAVSLAMVSRLQNCGQVCSCGKRYIIHEKVYEEFMEKLLKKVTEIKLGDPMDPETQMGPLARADLRASIERQVAESIAQGGKLLYGGKRPEDPKLQAGNFYMPTILEVDRRNILFHEETFGPVFAITKAKSDEEILDLANDTDYGLGCVIVSKNTDRAEEMGRKIECGLLFINEVTRSDIRMPSGGVKGSGYGRDCAEYGVYEFANIKTIWIAPGL